MTAWRLASCSISAPIRRRYAIRCSARDMSQTEARHTEILRDMYGTRTMEELAVSLHRDAELRQLHAAPDTDDSFGRDEFVRGVGRWLAGWDRFRFIPQEVID